MKIWIGKILIVIGIIHSFVGFIIFHKIIGELISEMLFNTIYLQLERHAAFWDIYVGFALIIIGWLINLIEHNHIDLPPFLKYVFLILTSIGCIVMPISGFWLLIIPTIGMFLPQKLN